MADLNALIAQGAQFNMPDQLGQYAKMQQLQAGQQQMQAGQQQMRTAALQEQTAGMQLQQLKQDRDNMAKLSQQLAVKGIGPRQYFEALQTSNDPKHQQLGVEGLMKLNDTEKYDAFLRSQQTIPAQQAPAPMAGELGTGRFGLDSMPGMPNALAPRAAAPMASTNALAPTSAADPVAALETKIAQLRNFPDPRAQAEAVRLQKQVDQYNQPYAVGGNLVTGGGKTLFTAPEKAAAPPAMVAEYTFAKTPDGGNFKGSYQDFVTARAAAGRAPAAPRPEAAPVAVVDPVTKKQIYVTREKSFGMTPASAMESLAPKEIQAREAKYPQATLAVKTIESSSDRLASDLDELAQHPGLSGISGIIYGNTPAITKNARVALEKYKSILARGGFSELQSMRAASPTGGALGNVSNQENQYLRDAFAAIGRSQDTADLKTALESAANVARASKQRVRDAYDMTYDYKTSGGTSVDASNPLLK
jgi:hypothetical protein